MITIPNDYTPLNSSVTKYTYLVHFSVAVSSLTGFSYSTYVTDSMRAVYGYNSSSKIVALGIKLNNFGVEYSSAGTLDVPSHLRLGYDIGFLFPLGSGSPSAGSVVLGQLSRSSASSVVKSMSVQVPEVYFQTLTSSISTIAGLTYTVRPFNNAASPLSSADVCQYSLLISEYVSKY